MTTHDEVHELIYRSWRTPDGSARIAVAEQALTQAEALGDPDCAFSARLAATSAYHQGGEPAKGMLTFARCVADYDADPGRRSAEDERLLLWQFKFAVSSMLRFPDIPLDRTISVLDDMERRYRAGGHSLHAVYSYRHAVAAHLGDTVMVDYWYRMWDTAPRDGNSDCAGCDPTSKAYHHLWFGTDEDAIAVAEAALNDNLTCAEQPQAILTALLLPYLRTHRLEEARNAHRRAYRALCGNVADLGLIAEHLHFCGLTGNETRGLELIERHLSWLDKAPTPKAEMSFAASAAQVLKRLADKGQGDLTVRRSGEPVTVAGLAESLRERSLDIAARFDARNGNGYQGGVVAATLDAVPVVEHLPLSLTAERQPRVQIAPPPGPIPETDLGAIPASLSLDAQLDRVEAMSLELDPRVDALTERMHAQFEGMAMTPGQRARLARIRAARERTPDDVSVALFRGAVEDFIAEGDRQRELFSRAQLALTLIQMDGDKSHAAPGLEASAEALAICTEPALRVSIRVRMTYLHMMIGQEEAALSCLDAAETEPFTMPVRRRAQLLYLRGGILLQRGDIEAGIAALRESVDLLRPLGPGDELGAALMTLGGALMNSGGDTPAIIAAFEEAGAMASDPQIRRGARANAGFLLVGTERAGQYIDDIVEHVCLMVAHGSAKGAAFTRHRLALALLSLGRYHEAAEEAEDSLAWFLAQGEDRDMEAQLRDVLAQVYGEMDEPHTAIGQFQILLDTMGPEPDPRYRGSVLARMAGQLSRVDRDAEAARHFDEAAHAYAAVDDAIPMLHARRRRAMTLHFAGEHDAAVEAANQLTTLHGLGFEVPEEKQATLVWEKALTHYESALILAHHPAPDYAAALHRIAPAAALLRSIHAFGEALLAELRLGQILVMAERSPEAQRVFETILRQLPVDHGARRDTAEWLARSLDEQGEYWHARKVRQEHGLPTD